MGAIVSRATVLGYAPVQMASATDCDIRLTLPARAETMALVRHVVGALAEALHMPPGMVEDVRLAVTEACTNVVRHAYAGRDGALEVEVASTAPTA